MREEEHMGRQTSGLAMALVSLWAAACGGGGGSDPDAGGGLEPFVEVPIGAPATATIGAAGGTLTSTDGHLRLDIPAGALAADTAIEIQQIEWPEGLGWALRPDGLAFALPVGATLTFGEAEAGTPTRTTVDAIETLSVPLFSVMHTAPS